MARIESHRELDVYKMAFEAAMDIFEKSKAFPAVEKYSLTDQIRRSSRSVCANLTEAWRKRTYPKLFVSKILDSEGEAAETQNWLEFAHRCGYLDKQQYDRLNTEYDHVIGKLVNMRRNPGQWKL